MKRSDLISKLESLLWKQFGPIEGVMLKDCADAANAAIDLLEQEGVEPPAVILLDENKTEYEMMRKWEKE